jgi:hypothetical protein
MPVCAPAETLKEAHRAPPLGDEQRGCLAKAESAVAFRNVDHEEAQLAGALEQRRHHAILSRLNVVQARKHLTAE